MAQLLIRNLPDEVHRAIKARAEARTARGERGSVEAEARELLIAATRPSLGIGDALYAIGQELGGVDIPIDRPFESIRSAEFD